MTSLVLSGRLRVPPALKDELARPRLDTLLDRGLMAKLTLLAAPAGYGKSTALAQWARRQVAAGVPVAWLSLDERDREPRSFLRALCQALQAWRPGLGEQVLAMLDWQQPPEPGLMLDRLLADLESLAEQSAGVLVFDEWQRLGNPELDALLARLLAHLPRALHVYLGSRHRPEGLPLARLRAARELIELGSGELAFNAAETTELLGRAQAAEAPCLTELSRGWPLGLQLLRLACADAPDWLPANGTPPGDELAAYLLDEIVSQLEPELLDLLGATAAVARFDKPLARLLSGQTDADRLLQQALQRNLFLQPIEAGWYAYHPAFAALLRARLSSAKLARLRGQASAYFRSLELHEDAIALGLTSDAPALALPSLDAIVPAKVLRGEIGPVLDWLGRYDKADLLAWPRLCVYYGCALVQAGRLDEAEFWLGRARARYADRREPEDYPVLAQLANIETTLAHARQDHAGMLASSAAALQAIEGLGGEGEASAIAWFNRGMACLLDQRLAEAGSAFAEAARQMPLAGDPLHAIDAGCMQAHLLHWRGELAQARAAYEALIAQADALGLSWLNHTILARLGLAEIQLVHQEYAALDRQLAAIVWPEPAVPSLRLRAAWLRWQAGQRGQAMTLLETAGSEPDEAAACLSALMRDDKKALAQALPALEDRLRRDLSPGRHLSVWILIQGLTAHGQLEGAQSWQQRWLTAIAPAEARHLEFLSRLLLHPEGKALATLLAQGAESGYLWPVTAWLPPAKLQQALPALPKAYADRLKTLLPAQASLLSAREREILQLMQAGHSNQAIAEQLVVSLNTIKTHSKHIYEKLGVNSRAQALMKALEAGLL